MMKAKMLNIATNGNNSIFTFTNNTNILHCCMFSSAIAHMRLVLYIVYITVWVLWKINIKSYMKWLRIACLLHHFCCSSSKLYLMHNGRQSCNVLVCKYDWYVQIFFNVMKIQSLFHYYQKINSNWQFDRWKIVKYFSY